MKMAGVMRFGTGVAVWMVGAAIWGSVSHAEVRAAVAPGTYAMPEVFGMPAGAAPQVKDDLFPGTEKFAKNASDVTEVNLDPTMLNAVGDRGKDGNKDFARRMDFVVVHSYTYDQPGMYRQEDLEEYRQRLAGNGWKCFIHERSKKESSDICQRPGADPEVNEMAIMTAEPKELTFVHMKGRMSLSEMSMKGHMASMGGGNMMMMPFLFGAGGDHEHSRMTMKAPPTPNTPPPPVASPAPASPKQ